jgi:hypothetical protein
MSIAARYDAARRVLVLTASNDGRAALAEAARAGGYQRAEDEVSEALHEAYEFVRPEDVPGAMTDAPILVDSDALAYPDNGERIILPGAKVFWFPDYMVTDPWELLRTRGRVEFEEADDANPDADPAPLVPDDVADYLPGGPRCGELFYIAADVQTDRTALPPPVLALYAAGIDDGRDLIDPGLYFCRKGSRGFRRDDDAWALWGPYAPTFSGADHAYKDGAVETPDPRPAPPQPDLFTGAGA